mmetsp:Transcript_45718/g.71632  ORF Transcript_45718/g.71632 Transcript_45718/m.71632 type:complete len:221 (-) Transcript_45718:703-1365(-)
MQTCTTHSLIQKIPLNLKVTRCLVSDHANPTKVSDIMREPITRAGNEHEITRNPQPTRHLGHNLRAESTLNQDQIDNHLRIASINDPQVLRDRLDHRIVQVFVHVDHLQPLGKLVVLHVAHCLVQNFQIVVLGKEDNLLAADFIHGHLRDSSEAILQVGRALGYKEQEVFQQPDTLKHQDGDSSHDSEVHNEVDQMPWRQDDIADQCNQHSRECGEVGGP